MKWAICFADREYAREHGDPDLGVVDAETHAEAIEKAWADKEIARRRFGHTAGLWAYPAREQDEEGRRR
jgi:hypothetical protein